MKCRTANKIIKAVEEGDDMRHAAGQIAQAYRIVDRIPPWWRRIMDRLGKRGRAEVLKDHYPATALRLLLEYEDEK